VHTCTTYTHHCTGCGKNYLTLAIVGKALFSLASVCLFASKTTRKRLLLSSRNFHETLSTDRRWYLDHAYTFRANLGPKSIFCQKSDINERQRIYASTLLDRQVAAATRTRMSCFALLAKPSLLANAGALRDDAVHLLVRLSVRLYLSPETRTQKRGFFKRKQ